MYFPTLSPQHYRVHMIENFGPSKKLFEQLDAHDLAQAASLRAEIDALVQAYFRGHWLRQDYLLTRAIKIWRRAFEGGHGNENRNRAMARLAKEGQPWLVSS